MASSAADGRLRIKFKIFNPGDENGDVQSPPEKQEQTEAEAEADEPLARICDVCKKEFKSPKALGGHMRVHVQSFKKTTTTTTSHKLKKKTQSRRRRRRLRQLPSSSAGNSNSISSSSTVNSGSSRSIPCSLCPKNFPSNKSLFGHMRCHPERDWRGIHPPPSVSAIKNCSNSSSLSNAFGCNNDISDHEEQQIDSMAVDLSQSLKGWSKTSKRGRKLINHFSDCGLDGGQVPEAVHNLMLLAHGIEERSSLITNKAEIDDADHGHQTNKKKKKNKRRRKTRDLELVGEYDSDGLTEKYKCTTCNKSFQTHQALGGHCSSHNKLNNPNPSLTSANAALKFAFTGNIGKGYKTSAATTKMMMTHACNICNKMFLSGQALGGHKRCHSWTAIMEPNQTAPKVLDLDLNKEPAVEDGEEESRDHASASCCIYKEAKQRVARGHEVLELDLNELPAVEYEDEGKYVGTAGGGGNNHAYFHSTFAIGFLN